MNQTPDLSALAPDYDIVGQLDDAADSRTYVATRKGDGTKRRDDQTGVLITVVTTPEGDEANALSQLAADTKLLIHTPHRRLIPVLDGRWLGDDAFAVVTQRTADPSLAQRLATGETFTNPRIAAILRDVNGLLEWARDQKIVHRRLTASRIYLEPKTDRVRVAFAIAPIKRLHRTDAQDDARTIARLAMAMLTGDEDPRAYEGQTLAELRPDLPEQLGAATSALLDEKNTGAVPDVPAYLALIGMADPVAAGEQERERIRAEILEEQRAEREKLADERAAFEKEMADERAAFAKTMADDRASFERTIADERQKLEAEREALQMAATQERDALQRAVAAERAQLAATRAQLERTVADQRAELERTAANDRRQIDALREEIRRAGEREVEMKRQTALDDIVVTDHDALDDPALATPTFVAPILAPLEALAFDDATPLMSDEEIVFAPPVVEAADVPPADEPVPVAGERASSRRKWILSGSVAAAVLVVAGIGASLLGGRQPAPRRTAPARTAAVSPAVIAPVAAPTPAPAAVTPPVPLAMDSTTRRLATRWLDSLKEKHPVDLPPLVRPVRTSTADGATSRPGDTTARRPGQSSTPAVRRPSAADNPFFIPGSTTPPPAPRPDTMPTPPR